MGTVLWDRCENIISNSSSTLLDSMDVYVSSICISQVLMFLKKLSSAVVVH